jgi:hypothetical protein
MNIHVADGTYKTQQKSLLRPPTHVSKLLWFVAPLRRQHLNPNLNPKVNPHTYTQVAPLLLGKAGSRVRLGLQRSGKKP